MPCSMVSAIGEIRFPATIACRFRHVGKDEMSCPFCQILYI